MSAGRKGLSGLATAAIFIVLEVAAVGVMSRTSSLQNIWINRASHRVLAFTWGWGDDIRDYLSLRATNDRLAEENHALLSQLVRYRNLYPEGEPDIAGGVTREPFRYTSAKIVKISRNSQHNYIIIDKGSEDGIIPHSGIISSDGIVGIIDAVDKHYSYGLTLMNSRVAVSTRIGKTGPVVVLSWDGKGTKGGILRDVPLHCDVSPGDTIYTSGISELFPGDIPVGVIDGSIRLNGPSGEVSVELLQDFSYLRYVTVVSNPGREEMLALEKKEEEL